MIKIFQSVKDTENEFTECQTPRKKLQSIGISPVSLHAFTKLYRAIIQKHKKYKLTAWLIQSLILAIKMTCKRNWMSYVAQGNARKIENSIIFRTNPNSYLKNDSFCLLLWCSLKCCAACWCNGRGLDIQEPDQINFVLL